MMNRIGWIAATLLMPLSFSQAASDALQRDAAWQTPANDVSIEILRDALTQQNATPQLIEQAIELFAVSLQNAAADRLDAFVNAAAQAVPAVDEILQAIGEDPAAPTDEGLNKLATPLRGPVEAYIGRSLVRQRLFDEALPLLADIEFATFIDPATLLFYRAACNHSLLHKKQTLEDLRVLLENDTQCPVRYARTAKLMLADIKPLEEDSLDEISRLMSDVERRLDLGRANDKVQQQEQAIIDKLSKLIDKIEQQQQQQQQQQQSSSGGGSGNAQGGQSQPMQDSQAAGGGGNGDVDRRDLGDRDGWGKLPPAERQEALQKIGRDLPTHYRDAIEAYFRKLATDK